MSGTIIKEADVDYVNKIAIAHDKKAGVWRVLKVTHKQGGHEATYSYQRNILSEHDNLQDAEKAFDSLAFRHTAIKQNSKTLSFLSKFGYGPKLEAGIPRRR